MAEVEDSLAGRSRVVRQSTASPPPIKEARRCASCNAWLSMYNHGSKCFSCQPGYAAGAVHSGTSPVSRSSGFTGDNY